MEPASIRTKNPGAMWPGPIPTKWGSKRWIYLNDGTGQGGGGHGNKIAIFDNWVDGICAQLDLWRTSKNYKNKRFADAIEIWSGGNHVASYIAYVKARIPGMDENTIMNDSFWKSPNGIKFLKVQAAHEAGKVIPAPEADWIEAQQRVFSGVPTVNTVKQAAVSAATGTLSGATAAVQAGISLPVALAIGAAVAVAAFLWWKFKPGNPEHDLPAVPVTPTADNVIPLQKPE